MITRSSAKCSENATTEEKNLYTPKKQRTLASSVSEKKEKSVKSETHETPIENIKKVNLKRSRTPLSTPRKKVRNNSPEVKNHEVMEKTSELPQTPIFNINIHVPPITVNSPLPGLPPIQPIICLNFDDLTKTLDRRETFTSSPENTEKSVEKLKELFTKVTPKCNIFYQNGENSFTPVHNTNAFQCNTKNNNLNSDNRYSNVNLNFITNCNNSLKKAMKDSMISSKQLNTLRSSKSSKKEKSNLPENDKDFMSIAPEMDGKLNSLIRKELRRNLSTSDLDDLKILIKKKLKGSSIDKNIKHSDLNFSKKFNLKQAVVVLENIDDKIYNNVNQELSFETFSERINKTSSLNNSKDSVDFEEDSSKSGDLKLKKGVCNKNGSKKHEDNYSKSFNGITSKCVKDFNVNTAQNCLGSEGISRNEILKNIKRVVSNYLSSCESNSSDIEIVKDTSECLNNSFKQTKINCNSSENENVVDNRNKTDFSLTKKSFKSSEKSKTKCKKSLKFDNSDLQPVSKERSKIYPLVYESDTSDSIQKEKISSIIEGCNFSELIKKIQNNEIRKEILSLVKNSDNLNSKNSEFCDSNKNCEVSDTEKTSKNVNTDDQLEKCQESNKNTSEGSEISVLDVEKNTNFYDSDESIFSSVHTANKAPYNFDDLMSGSKENKTNSSSDKDSVTNSYIYDDDDSESMSSASTVLFDGLQSCTQSEENENDRETPNRNNDDCSDYEKNEINVGRGRKKKKTSESESDGENKSKNASENSDGSEGEDNDTSDEETKKNEKDFSNVSSVSCSSKETQTKSGNKFKDCSSSEDENERKKNTISKKPNNSKKYNEQIDKDKGGENETFNARKNNSSDSDNSSDSSEDEDEGKNNMAFKKTNTNNKCEEIVKDIGVSETVNARKNISSDSENSSDSSEDEDERKSNMAFKKTNANNKCEDIVKDIGVSETVNATKNNLSDRDSSENENEEKSNEDTLKFNGNTGFHGKIREEKKINENVCEDSDSSEDDNEEKPSLILEKANYNKKRREEVIEDVEEESETEKEGKNFSSDESGAESMKKTNYNSFNEKFEQQKRRRFKSISERSDSEDENQKEKRTEHDESKKRSVDYSESSESEDEDNEKTGESFGEVNRKEKSVENVKRNIFKNDENEEKKKSSKKISKRNGCGKNPQEEIEFDGEHNSDSSESEEESKNFRNHRRGSISGGVEEGGKKWEKVNSKKRNQREEEESDDDDDDDCESGKNGFSRGCARNGSKINGGGYPGGDKPRKKVKKTVGSQSTEVQTLETEIKRLSNESSSKLEEEHYLDLDEEGKVKRHAKSSKKSKKNLGKRNVQVIEKHPNHQESSPRKKKMGKFKSKAKSSSKVKSKEKVFTEDYIPLKAMGSTRFAVSNLNKLQPYQKHSALNFKKEMFFGDRVKRFKSNAEFAAYKHKQNVRNFKE